MILQRLYELSERLELVKNAQFKEEKVDFVLHVDSQGTLIEAVSLRNEKGKGTAMLVPKPPKRASGIRAGFLYDNAKYVLGVGSGKPERDAKTMTAFRERIEGAAQATKDPGLIAVLGFYDNSVASARDALREQFELEEWTGDERFCFALATDGGRAVHERPDVKAWLDQQAESSANDEPHRICLVTGKKAPAARLHDNVKGVAGAKSSGAAVVSFNSGAFTTHGLEKGANAAVSRDASNGYVAALNWLLAKDGKRPHRSAIRTGETTTLFWTKEEDEGPELFASIFDSRDPEEVRVLLDSPWFGAKRSVQDTNAFYVLTLGGNAARVVVREWLESSISDIQTSVHRFFADTAIHDNEAVPLRVLLDALKPRGKAASLPPDLEGKMIRAALFGDSIPTVAMHQALRRIAVPGFEGRTFERARFGLIRAFLIRNGYTTNQGEITVSLDSENRSTDYNLGRLFALIEYLQGQALGERNAGIRDKYFAAASSRPASVIPRLLSVSVHHESKLKKTKPGFAVRLSKLKGEIMESFPASGFPSNLNLEAQGRFAIGYYHQRQDFYTPREDAQGDA